MKKTIIGVMGGGSASVEDIQNAHRLGRLIAEAGWVLLPEFCTQLAVMRVGQKFFIPCVLSPNEFYESIHHQN